MSCGITDGISITCADLKRVGGVKKDAYLFNISDLSTYSFTNGYVSALNFILYAGLYKFSSRKQAHSGGWVPVVQDPGGNKFFQHDVILKLFSDDPDADAIEEALLVSEVGIILETNNREFVLYGPYNGMEVTAGAQNTGQAPASDIAESFTFTGFEEVKPLRVLDTDYATTKALLETYLV